MNTNTGPYRVINLSTERRLMISMLDLPGVEHCMVALLEVDVTVARQVIARHKRCTGEALSFTGYLAYCLARAVDEDKSIQAFRKGNKQLVLFDDVDIGLMVEHKTGEKRALMGHVIRVANRMTYLEIHREIRSVQSTPLPPNRGLPKWFLTAMLLPWPFSRIFIALLAMVMRRNPLTTASMGGTVGVTAVGMFGEGINGWGLGPLTGYSLGLLVGSIAWKPTVVAGHIEPREILNLTVVFDHDLIDGAPAARFTHRLLELIESGYGLEEAGDRTSGNPSR